MKYESAIIMPGAFTEWTRLDTYETEMSWIRGVETIDGGSNIEVFEAAGELKEAKSSAISVKRKSRRSYGVRKSRDYIAERPGDLVQVGTLGYAAFSLDHVEAIYGKRCDFSVGCGEVSTNWRIGSAYRGKNCDFSFEFKRYAV